MFWYESASFCLAVHVLGETKPGIRLSSGAIDSRFALHHIEKVRHLIESYQGDLEPPDYRPMSASMHDPLMLRLVQSLVAARANSGDYPAVHERFRDLMTLAHSRGASVNAKTYLGLPILFSAAMKCTVAVPVLAHMVDLGADVDAVPKVAPEGLIAFARTTGGEVGEALMREAILRRRVSELTDPTATSDATSGMARSRRRHSV